MREKKNDRGKHTDSIKRQEKKVLHPVSNTCQKTAGTTHQQNRMLTVLAKIRRSLTDRIAPNGKPVARGKEKR